MFVIATTSPPARMMRSATTLSSAGTNPWRMREPQVSGMPAIATESLTATRFPDSTPSALSAWTWQKRTIAFSGSSPSAGRRPGSRTASTGATTAGSWDSRRSKAWKTTSAIARSCSASASSTVKPHERASSCSSSGRMRSTTALYSFQNDVRTQPSSSGVIVWASRRTSVNFQPSGSLR